MTDHPHRVDVYVGQRLRMLRKQHSVSQETIAKALGLTFQQVQKYERGANRISASKLYEIACFLHVPPGYFFDGLGVTAEAPIPEPPLDLDFPQAKLIPGLSPKSRRALGGLIESMVQ